LTDKAERLDELGYATANGMSEAMPAGAAASAAARY
jgi:hypothetical protein